MTTPTVQDLLSSQNATVVFSLLAVSVLAVVVLYKLLFSGETRRLPPGPHGLPLLGNLLSLDPELHTQFAGLAETHGPIFKLRLGTKLGVVISSQGLAKEVLRENDLVFANRDVPAAGRVAAYGGRDVVWSPYGQEWRTLRKVCVVKMLSNATLDSVYELRRREVRRTVGFFHSRVGSKVNFGEQMFLTILNVLTNMLWGGSFEEDEERDRVGSEFRQLVSEMTALLGKPNVSDFYPGLARFDLQGVAKQMGRIVPRFDRIFDKLIASRSVDGSEGKMDFLQYLLKLKDEEDSRSPLTLIHVKALMMDMVVGGSDTSSNSIEFAMAEIINQPHIMKKAQQELDDIIGKDKIVEESHIHKLPYLQAVMKESLRLHPALPLMVPHCPSEDCHVGGYSVPSGSRVFVNVWAIHRDPTVWENPTKFDPERFLNNNNNNNNFDFSGNDFSYFPFGSGRRICAGIAMAERMVLYSLASLLHSFDWKVPDGEELDLSEKFGIVLKKRTPLFAVPTLRLSDPKLYA